MPDRAEVTYDILGTDDHRTGVQTASNAETVLRVQQSFLRPWLPFEYDWNAADAYNLCLFSDLAYRKQEVDDASERLRAGIPPREPENRGISKIWTGLESGRRQFIELASSDLAPGGEFPLMTRSAPEGKHFQDLRFWDSNQIGADRDTQPPSDDVAEQFQRYYSDTQAFAASSSDQILISCRGTCYHFIALLLGLALLLIGCAGEDSKEPKSVPFAVHVHGKKPDTLKVGLRVMYMSLSDNKLCRRLTASSMTLVPTYRIQYVWPDDGFPDRPSPYPNTVNRVASSGMSTPSHHVKAAGSTKYSETSYSWTAPIHWTGDKMRCDYTPISIGIGVYDPGYDLIGGISVRVNMDIPNRQGKSRRDSIYYPSIPAEPIEMRCSAEKQMSLENKGDHNARNCSVEWSDEKDVEPSGYSIDSISGDTVSIALRIS